MKKYAIQVKFGNKPDDKAYSYLTYYNNLQPGDRVFVDVGRDEPRPKPATVVDYPNTVIPDVATKWVLAAVDIEHHQEMVKQVEEDDGHPDAE